MMSQLKTALVTYGPGMTLLVGLCISLYGFMLVSFPSGFMAELSRWRYFLGLLISRRFLRGQPFPNRDGGILPAEAEWRGWSFIVRGFALQIIATIWYLILQIH